MLWCEFSSDPCWSWDAWSSLLPCKWSADLNGLVKASALHANCLIIDVAQLAFFTNKKVEAFEELTWVRVIFYALCWPTCTVLISQGKCLELWFQDYGIGFDDTEGPSKPFRCMCGSRYCRDPNNPSMLPFSMHKSMKRGIMYVWLCFDREDG